MMSELEELRDSLKPIRIEPVGSTVTCDPAPKNTDRDYLVLFKYGASYTVSLPSKGFKLEGEGHYDPSHGDFSSWRKGDVNIIATHNVSFFDRFVLATFVAKELNLLDKKDRIVLSQAILYGNMYKPLCEGAE